MSNIKEVVSMDSIDRRILDIIQTAFPITPRPYADIATQVGITEEDAFARVESLKENHIIRRLGANFQSKKLGFCSTLCAAKVPSDKMDFFVEKVNEIPGVTHNYLRNHEYNIWFTLIAASWDRVCEILAEISLGTGVAIANFPAKTTYKIRVDFALSK